MSMSWEVLSFLSLTVIIIIIIIIIITIIVIIVKNNNTVLTKMLEWLDPHLNLFL